MFNVLLAEDEQFQRLALLDILTLCDYEGRPIKFLSTFEWLFMKICDFKQTEPFIIL